MSLNRLSLYVCCFITSLFTLNSFADDLSIPATSVFRCYTTDDSLGSVNQTFKSQKGTDRQLCRDMLPKEPASQCTANSPYGSRVWEPDVLWDGWYKFYQHYNTCYSYVDTARWQTVSRGLVDLVKFECPESHPFAINESSLPGNEGAWQARCWRCSPGDLKEYPPQIIEKEVNGIKQKFTRHFSKDACPVDIEDIESCKIGLFNPIACRTGEKLQTETDFSSGDLQFSRKFRSQPEGSGLQVPQWFNADEVTISWLYKTAYDQVVEVQTGDGGRAIFSGAPTATILSPTTPLRGNLQLDNGSWVWTMQSGTKYTFGPFGKTSKKTTTDGLSTHYTWEEIAAGVIRLVELTAPSGRRLRFEYNSVGLMTTMIDPNNGVTKYVHDALGRLTHVTYADQNTREYTYEDNRFPQLLTGIIDENGKRYATFAYDNKARGILSEHAGHAQKGTFEYLESGNTIVQTHQNENSYRETLYIIDRVNGRERLLREEDFPCPGCTTGVVVNEYDANGWLKKTTDRNGNIITYIRDAQGRETSRTEGVGTAHARTTTTVYDSYGRPYDITSALKRTYIGFNSKGTPNYVWEYDKVSGSSITTYYTYTVNGQLQTVDGPRTDVTDTTSYTYDAQRNVSTITNALNHVTQITAYDANGKPLTIIDPNGLVTTLTYTPRGWLKTREVGGLLTTFDYDKVGQLTQVTMPDGSFVAYQYDDAHRLTDISDTQGNRIHYTLDYAGNRVKEELFDASNILRYQHSRTFNALNQLLEDINAQNEIVARYGYDANGNMTAQQRELDGVAQSNNGQAYDALNRLSKITDSLNGVTDLTYDTQDNLTSVTDPKRLLTQYNVDGFGQLKQTTSPDTGVTPQTFDSAGNIKTSTNANGKTTTYTYDALNRVTRIKYHDNTTVTFAYDSSANGNYGKGRLTSLTDASGSTAFVYDQLGRLKQKTQTISGKTLTTAYQFDTYGRLSTQTLPSGAVMSLSYSNGQISSLQLNNVTQVSAITYQPFGGVKSFNYANGKLFNRTFDLDGRLDSFTLATQTVSVAYDRASRITALSNQTFGYDALDRLTSANGLSYAYDANGNRLSVNSDTYTVSGTSNRVTNVNALTYQYDAAGNITNDGTNTFTFNAANRLSKAQNATATADYVYNGLGQRVKKTVVQNGETTTMLFAYDEAGRIVGTYNADGSLVQEIVYLGDIPAIVITPTDNYYVHSDQLNTPREITNSAGTVVWQWQNTDPFGNNPANEDVDGDGTKFVFNHRFAGQYFDSETGLHQNYYRDYSPQLGRYIESDPIGLDGGINTYGYVNGNPISTIDPYGLSGCTWVGIGIICDFSPPPPLMNPGDDPFMHPTHQPMSIWGGRAPVPRPYSHADENTALNVPPGDNCNQIRWAIMVAEAMIVWRKMDLNPFESGTRNYVNHKTRIKELEKQRDRLKRDYNARCKDTKCE